MKILISFVNLLFTTAAFTQSKQTLYLELRGSVDVMGNIYILPVTPPKKMNREDSLTDYKQVNTVIIGQNPVRTMNNLAKQGWVLISVTHVIGGKDNTPNSPFLLYYFRKEL